YTYDPATLRLTSQGASSTFTYDDNGNLRTTPNATYAYSPRNMMQSATIGTTTTSYLYDADDWRVKETSGPTNSYFIRGPHGELLAEWTDPGTAGSSVRDYIYAGARLVAVVKR